MKTLGNKGFHALESPYSDFETSKVVIVPVCYALNVRGATDTPKHIITASHKVDSFDESLMAAGGPVKALSNMSLEQELDMGDTLKIRGLATLDYISPLVNYGDKNSTIRRLELDVLTKDLPNKIFDLLELGKVPIILGGDHSITPFVIQGFKKKFDNLAVLHFDSRLDLLKLTDYSKIHRSVMRKIFPEVELIMSVGYRAVKREEMKFLRENRDKIHGIMMRDQLRPLNEVQTALNSIKSYLKGRNVYITFDASFLDPSTIIGYCVKASEPGGMTYDETLDIWARILPHLNVVGADFVEFCVSKDNNYNFDSIRAFAKLISRFISRLNLDKKEG